MTLTPWTILEWHQKNIHRSDVPQSRKKTGFVALHESSSTSNCVSTVTKGKQGLPSPLHKPLFYFVLLSLITKDPTVELLQMLIMSYASTTLFQLSVPPQRDGFWQLCAENLAGILLLLLLGDGCTHIAERLIPGPYGWSSHNVLIVRVWNSDYLWNVCSKKASNQCHCCKISLLKVEERHYASLSLINSSRYAIGGRTTLIFFWVERNMALTSL
jgi:hypothetical protein